MSKTYYPSLYMRRRGKAAAGHKKILINYATEDFIRLQKTSTRTGLRWGRFDKVICYGPQDIDAEFYERNRGILTERRGAGYWLWKPHVILKTLEQMKSGDYLFYADSDYVFIDSIDVLIHVAEKADHQIVARLCKDYNLKKWIKRDALILLDMDKSAYLIKEQTVEAGLILLRKSDKAMEFIKEWLELCRDRRLITDDKNVMGKPNYPEFVDHRHDQSIFTLLYIKHGFVPYVNFSLFNLRPGLRQTDDRQSHVCQKMLAAPNFECPPFMVSNKPTYSPMLWNVFCLLFRLESKVRRFVKPNTIRQESVSEDARLEKHRALRDIMKRRIKFFIWLTSYVSTYPTLHRYLWRCRSLGVRVLKRFINMLRNRS